MFALRKLMPEISAEYFELSRKAEEAQEREVNAVVRIQAAARGFLTRRRLDRLAIDSATTLQRYWRGYLGRQRALLAREMRDKKLRQIYFDKMATTIQRHWRGFWSRKALFDFYARKRYLAAVRTRNEELRAELAEEEARATAMQQQATEEAARKLFDDKISKLHHLLSTSAQPGIFNSPYSVATGTVPAVAGLPIEDHLREAYRTQPQKLPPIKKKGTLGHYSMPYGSDVVFQGQKVPHNITLRQMVPYDTVHENQVMEENIKRGEVLTVHPHHFVHTKVPDAPMLGTQSNRNILPYTDPFDPTLGVRNERFSSVQQKISTRPFGRHVKKQPYFDQTLNRTDGY